MTLRSDDSTLSALQKIRRNSDISHILRSVANPKMRIQKAEVRIFPHRSNLRTYLIYFFTSIECRESADIHQVSRGDVNEHFSRRLSSSSCLSLNQHGKILMKDAKILSTAT